MKLFDLFAMPLEALLLLGVAYAIMFGGFDSRFTKLLFKWVVWLVIINAAVHMFIPH